MFHIYRKNVGGRIFDRYYKDYDNAKKQLNEDVSNLINLGATLIEEKDHFNKEKGVAVYQKELNLNDEYCSLAIIDGHFSD